jgi:hypothetical protein
MNCVSVMKVAAREQYPLLSLLGIARDSNQLFLKAEFNYKSSTNDTYKSHTLATRS